MLGFWITDVSKSKVILILDNGNAHIRHQCRKQLSNAFIDI